MKVNVTSFQLRDDGVEAVVSEQTASAGELATKIAALNQAARPALAALERAVELVWHCDPTFFVFENGSFFSGEARDLWRLAVAFSESLDDIQRMRWVFSAIEVVRSNLRLFPLANGAHVLDYLAADAEKLVERVNSRIGSIVLEGGENSPTTPEIRGLVTRERSYGKPGLESWLRNVEAARVLVLYRLAHFSQAYESRSPEEAKAAETAN